MPNGRRGPAASHDDHLHELCHDVLQPVATIQVIVARMRLGSAQDDERDRQLSALAQEASYISALCRQAIEPPAAPREIDVSAVLTDATEAATAAYDGTIELTSPTLTAMGEPIALRRIVNNLLDNACRAAGPTGHVDVNASNDEQAVIIEVEDNGPGFADGTPGTLGIGLNIARRLATQHLGGLFVAKPGSLAGARLRLRLPRKTEPTPPSRG